MRRIFRQRAAALLLLAPIGFVACGDDEDPEASNSGGKAGSASQAGTSNKSGSANQAGDTGTGGGTGGNGSETLPGAAGPEDYSTKNEFEHAAGDADLGQDVFRFETFGNEGFWTGVMQLPQGVAAAKVTPLMALAGGLSVDIEKVPAAVAKLIAAELKTDLSPKNAPTLNSPAATIALVEANAVIGLSVRNVKKLNGTLDINAADIYAGESVGVTCALCHGITDGSVYKSEAGGSIGKRVDGPTNHNLNVGANLALALNSRAYYPTLAVELVANKGMSLSRKGPGVGLISKAATEAEVDAYLNDPELYPVGMFDDGPDGNGAPMHITPFFRTDLAAPWGSEGSIQILDNFGNLVYTALLDPTDLTTEGGRKFMMERGGAAGIELVDNYELILASIGIPTGGPNGYPFVGRAGREGVTIGLEAGAKVETSPIGMRVDSEMLENMNAYLNSLPSPAGDKRDPEAIARGRMVFRMECTSCHNDDQSKFVPQNVVPFNDTVELFAMAPSRPALFPGYDGMLLADRTASGLAPVRNSSGTFDDKMVVIDASNHDLPRGATLPLLMDLARKPKFLHDDSVATLEELLEPKARDANDPHPFFIKDAAERADVIAFLNSLDDQPLP